ncbi:hypothetical protein K431DRAFT_284552 [Polychaeton citri CBS 116435]|uniref:Heterokaryon incompatibility domain-containing protein n=1 Tax=Polychaeton citri CBS 116435 TaxID=1314669 RepID=A0A9P4UN15_9PEZI|nr:hypothetical protein K431DRAFT_284552 [Polychaeton citri CBS 116435]
MLDKRLLLVLWLSQLPLAALVVFRELLDLAIRLVRHGIASHDVWLFAHIAIDTVGFVLLIAEVSKYGDGSLRPRYLTLSHAFRAFWETLYFSQAIYHSIHYRSYYQSAWGWCAFAIDLISYYIGFAYGLWLWRLARTRQINESDMYENNDGGMSLVPRKILTASRLSSRYNTVSKVVNWIYRPTFEPEGKRESLSVLIGLLNACVLAFKWLIGTMVLVPAISLTNHLPGEPSSRLTHGDRTRWEYSRPKLDQPGEPKDRSPPPSSSRERRLHAAIEQDDEESRRATDLMSLHSIDASLHTDIISSTTTVNNENMSERHLGPRYLCFLDDSQPQGYFTCSTSDWAQKHGNAYPDYVFVSYTRLQFYTTIAGDPSLPAEMNMRLQEAAEQDMSTLIEFSIKATKAAHVDAFWIDYECVRPETTEQADESMEDVYRICDIVRACHSMAIIVGPRFNYADYSHETNHSVSAKAEWLQDWGSRLWTVPEALLCPGEHRIAIYASGVPEPEFIAKRNLPSRVWNDGPALRQLIDHYESSIHLTRLELITIALDCLKRRQTEKRMGGDVTYALQGLLRQRPRVIPTDTDFQAFARLSLANDSDMLLERLFSLRPNDIRAPWHDMEDVWGAKLWDITPICQVADIVEGNTVVLGDTKGAMINWSSLESVDYELVRKKNFFWTVVRLGPLYTLTILFGMVAYIGAFFIASSLGGRSYQLQNIVSTAVFQGLIYVLVACLFISLFTPLLLRRLYGEEIHQAQARFYGIAGHPELNKVEELIFGFDQGRFQWITGASGDGDRPAAIASTEVAEHEEDGEGLRAFTLIDTCTLSAIPFKAEVPPSVAMACARTRGLVRVLLCSYDVVSKRFCKEAVLRMETAVLDRMQELDRVRFTLKQPV